MNGMLREAGMKIRMSTASSAGPGYETKGRVVEMGTGNSRDKCTKRNKIQEKKKADK